MTKFFWFFFFWFFFMRGEGDKETKTTICGQSSGLQRNAIKNDGPTCWLCSFVIFQGIQTSFAETSPYFFLVNFFVKNSHVTHIKSSSYIFLKDISCI